MEENPEHKLAVRLLRYVTLFNRQTDRLEARGCPLGIISLLQGQQSRVLSQVSIMDIPKGHIPFLPVIPISCLKKPSKLMSMIREGGREGLVDDTLNPDKIEDCIKTKTPKNPYYIFDIDDGKRYTGKIPNVAKGFIEAENRSCLTLAEGIALCIHTGVQVDHSVLCMNSLYNSDNLGQLLMIICHTTKGSPYLFWNYDFLDEPSIPSCVR